MGPGAGAWVAWPAMDVGVLQFFSWPGRKGELADVYDRALGRVLRNLLDNAIRHSPEAGEVTIADCSDTDRVRLEVVDEGAGFPQSFVPQAFDRFTQADDARSHPGGAGLGLAIARDLVTAQGGLIELESEPGRGTRVRVRL